LLGKRTETEKDDGTFENPWNVPILRKEKVKVSNRSKVFPRERKVIAIPGKNKPPLVGEKKTSWASAKNLV